MSTPSPPSNDHHDHLALDHLKKELLRDYEKDESLEPFIRLLHAVEAPDIDCTSPEVEAIINELKDINYRLTPEPEPPTLSHPFFDDSTGGSMPFLMTARMDAKQPRVSTFIDYDVEEIETEKAFSNWGQTVQFKAGHTLVVRTVSGVQSVVRWAAKQPNKPKVRVSGFRHSWSEVFGQDGDVIMMFLPFDTLTKIPYREPDPAWRSELTGLGAIQLVDAVAGHPAPPEHALCKVMAGVTNDQFREWCFQNKTVCIPLNVIMVEITFGGSNAPICHGAGLETKTLSDIVREIIYVDAKGELQVINDRVELLAAAGCFGLLGVVVSLTLELDMMYVTEMQPIKLPMALAIPPPPGYEIPRQVRRMMRHQGITDKDLRDAQKAFVERCESDHYLEWFWFPYQKNCWINTWSKRLPTQADVNIKAYPEEKGMNGVASQKRQASMAEQLVKCRLFKKLNGRMQAYVLGLGSMLVLPNIKDPERAIKTYVSEALHFRRGIQNFRCLDTEWEIPITTVNGTRNYEQIQRAWWDGISVIYEHDEAPVRVALEMRLTGGSDVLLAPQRGNKHGSASIEILTTLITPDKAWMSAMQEVSNCWSKPVRDEEGNKLYPRPHWAKQWAGLTVQGKDIKAYLKEDAYKEAFMLFRETFASIVTKRGSTVEQTLGMFGNALMTELIFE